jgi:5-methylcytosine-specific restriction protein A
MTELAQIIPSKKFRVFDILKDLDFDMTDWTESLANKDGNPSANPKYCFNWSFVREDKKVIVLNLWHEEMQIQNGRIYQTHQFKQYALDQSGRRKTRSLDIDQAVRLAYERKLPVHVVVCSGGVRDSGVKHRELDSKRWFVTGYDRQSGACIIERDSTSTKSQLIDQFEAHTLTGITNQYEKNGLVYVRSSYIRRRVLMRADGNCEYCSTEGFITNGGANYLETHHIIPLSEEGEDIEENVIALCPNDHRRAHFERESLLTRVNLAEIVRLKLSCETNLKH